jgi:hypothetical protein
LLPAFMNAQKRYDVLITECLPDPSPVVGLPETSFVELTNRSGSDFNLRNWKISNGSNTAVIKTDWILKADSLLILCPLSATEAFRSFGPALGISGFPALNNESGNIILINDLGLVIHAIHYDRHWFDNDLKAAGGWSLEMIDPGNPASAKENWRASISNLGGTPGSKNSVDALNPDERPVSLIRANAPDSLHLILIFDEPLDSLTASDIENYGISGGIGIPSAAVALPPFFDRIELNLSHAMIPGILYTVDVQQVRDVSLNTISLQNHCKAGIPQPAQSGDIIFNEILFNPPPFGFDYIELYNRSQKIISCNELFLAGREFSGSLKDPVSLINEPRAFFPGEYVLLTENPEWILNHYLLSSPLQILPVSALPSMPDDLGKLVLLNASGQLLDELDYDHHWHSPMLASEGGVALERIRSDLPTSRAALWTSAAADAGYGTPGYKNSESSPDSVSSGPDFVFAEPRIFSPDMDGREDFCFIHYQLPEAGFTGSISIYDISGVMVRKLLNNELLGTSGIFRWDGLDDQQNLLPTGRYIIYTEVFRTDGDVRRKKLVCVLAK